MSAAAKLVCSSTLVLSLIGASAHAAERTAPAPTVADTSSPAPSADLLFKLAKGAWRSRSELPFVTFNLREEYVWRGHVHDNWWTASYRVSDRNLRLARMTVPADEAARMRGFPIALNLRMHRADARADTLDTNPDADAFPILDPLIEPNTSFGLREVDTRAELVGSLPARPAGSATTTAASPQPERTDSAAPSAFATDKPLRELARVEATARDYTIAFAGTDPLGATDAYHLTLTPLRNPQAYRLRDIWIDPVTYATLRIAVQGLFAGKPYDGARWIVTYIALDGHYYIRDIRADDSLRFGIDRTVTGLRYDFVAYAFPQTLPDATFRSFL